MKKLLLLLLFLSTCFIASADTVTYYSDGYSAGTVWTTTPANMVDGSISTWTTTGENPDNQLLNSTTCDGTDLGTITKVEMRTYGYVDSYSGGDEIHITPSFDGGTGDDHDMGDIYVAWSSWVDITSDTNAPDPYTWGAFGISGLYLSVEGYSVTTEVSVAKVEVKVTYIASTGYANDVGGVASANIAKVSGVATADIAKVGGVE